MSKVLNIAIILFQTGFTFVLTFITYLVFALFDYKGGIANFIGLALFQPLLGLLFSGVTILLCFLVGLPLRLHKKLNIWWRKHFYIAIILIGIGICFCIISLTPKFIEVITYRMEGMDFEETVPNQFLSITGWFALAIGSLHLFPPYQLQQRIEAWFLKLKE